MTSTDNKSQEAQSNQNEELDLLQVGLSRKNKFLPELIQTAKKIGTRGKGILAADESTGTIGKRFATIELENSEENRRAYRELLFTSKDIGKYISGVIMYEETLLQSTKDGKKFVDVLKENGVIPGIKVDKGTKTLPYSKDDLYTEGLDGLDDRCKKYYQQGARFAKWRAVVKIVNNSVNRQSIEETAWTLARYAAICQENGLVPIVEPELLMDGNHSLEVCQYWQQIILTTCYKALSTNEVILEGTLLKPSMVLTGESYEGSKSIDKNAKATVIALLRTVPSAVPGIMFLSGGQSEEEATLHLNAINKDRNLPWTVSFSYGRALQDSCLKTWKGKQENIADAQATFIKRAKANSEAQLGLYKGDAATDSSKQSLFKKGYVY